MTNDDGVKSSGILYASEILKEFGEITIVCPSQQRSGIGRAITLMEPLRLEKHELNKDTIAYGVSGTPCDSIIMGIFEIMDEKPDLVVSGINIGLNIGKSELGTSGTVGAAMEAASYGIPALAISQEVIKETVKFKNGKVDIDFGFAMKILRKVVKNIVEKGMPKGVDVLNLNIPANPKSDEIQIVELGERMYSPKIEIRHDTRGEPYYWTANKEFTAYEKGTDGYSIKNENISCISPLSLDCSTPVDTLDKWI